MNAEEARKLSIDNLVGEVINTYLYSLDEAIKKKASEGKRSIHNPQVGKSPLGSFYLAGDELDAVKSHYVSQGYKWVDHADPDPGHPCGGAYTTLEW